MMLVGASHAQIQDLVRMMKGRTGGFEQMRHKAG